MLNKTVESVKDCLEHLYMNFGVPRTIQADNGKEFSNNLLRESHAQLNIRVVHGNPRAQGQVERVNQTIKKWIDHLRPVVFKYNVTKHRATNQSPFFLFHGHPGFKGFLTIFEDSDVVVRTEPNNYEQWIFEDYEDQER